MRIIEIIISLMLVYAILSILTSLLVEWQNSRNKTRGIMLRQAIFQMLNDSLNLNYGYLLLKHPLVNSMNNKEENRPFQYLHSGIFADALIDVISDQANVGLPVNANISDVQQPKPNNAVELFEKGIEQMNDSSFKNMLQSLSLKSGGNYEKLKESIAEWYNRNNERTSGWYKRKQKKLSFVMGLLVAFVLNADSIHLFKVISMDDNLRNNLNLVAEEVASNYSVLDSADQVNIGQQIALIKSSISELQMAKADSNNLVLKNWEKKLDQLNNKLDKNDSISRAHLSQANEIINISAQLRLPIGWSGEVFPLSLIGAKRDANKKHNAAIVKVPKTALGKYLYKRNQTGNLLTFLGWLIGIGITGVMLSFGAPFWFDMLVKFVNIRKAGVKPTDNLKKVQQ